jgi:uncharacterized protein (TIGR02265 family)
MMVPAMPAMQPSAYMSNRSAAIDELCRGCDLVERLPLVPPSAKVRGIYFRAIERALDKARRRQRFDAIFPQRIGAVLWHPAADFLVRLTVGGALLAGPERIHQGMLEIGRGNAVAFAESLIGRTLLRVLDRDPKRLVRQALVGRRQGCNYGHWELELIGDHEAVMTMTEEYLYIESYVLGAAQGTFDAVGVPVEIQVSLHDRFNGKHHLRW